MKFFELLLILTLLPLLLCQLSTEEADGASRTCESVTINSCEDCLAASPECAWCDELNLDNSQSRCRTYQDHSRAGICASLVYPTSEIDPEGNIPLTEIVDGPLGVETDSVVQLRPQRINVKIRNGERVRFNITFRKVTDYPVDLYYLMDLSYSMRDDLSTLKNLGQQLATDIRQNVTQDIQMGFGTFVDKVLLPFASTVPDQLRNPCIQQAEGDNECAPPFDFRHQLRMTENLTSFRDSVNSTTISGNIDTPEGLFDALMQIAVCYEDIGWRDDSSHLVVITTDAPFHTALDGKLASIFEANDMRCHLSEGANPQLPNDTVYNRSKELDYPSIGQLRYAFAGSRIQPIFAVTEDVQPLYEELQPLIPNSFVDRLAADSSNIISIIQSAYNELRGRLEMALNDQIPSEISLNVRTLCPNATSWRDDLRCDEIQIGSEITYEFDVLATGCRSSNPTAPLVLSSSSLREDVEIFFDFLCNCNCSGNTTLNSDQCNGNGSFLCGVCVCNSGFEGPQCQCQRDEADVSLLTKCMRDGEGGTICGGNGECICGECDCREDFFGDFCECSRTGCARDNDGVCGGEEKGICMNCDGNNECSCIGNYSLSAASETCSCNPALCVQPGSNQTCSGIGQCQCNRCVCDERGYYSGTYCELCTNPDCHRQAEGCDAVNRAECARCVNEVRRRREDVAAECAEPCQGVEYQVVSSIPDCISCVSTGSCPEVCLRIDEATLPPVSCQAQQLGNEECQLIYQVVWSDQDDFLLLVKEYHQESDCPAPVNALVIVLPTVFGTVLIGLIGLIIWKYWQTQRDKREWENFENEQKQQQWTQGQNPIFEKPATRYENPIFQGGN